jgi:hypothetical protein
MERPVNWLILPLLTALAVSTPDGAVIFQEQNIGVRLIRATFMFGGYPVKGIAGDVPSTPSKKRC